MLQSAHFSNFPCSLIAAQFFMTGSAVAVAVDGANNTN